MKKHFFAFIAAFALVAQVQARDGFAIVIDQESYRQAKTEVEAYARCVEQMHNLKVYTVVDRWGIPDSIRGELQRLHALKKEPVIGTVLVGDIPIAMIRDAQHMTSAFKMNQKSPRKESSVPSDRFYDDFNLKFKPLGKDNDAPYFYYSLLAESAQRLHPTIYSGRIRPTDAGGVSRYRKLRDYLRKVVVEKQRNRSLRQMFFFSGHGYISDSKVARMDEKTAWLEHFPQLKGRTNAISYMDHSDHNPVKVNLMNELMRTDLDLAVLHHHGFFDTQYLNGTKKIQTVRQAKEFIQQSCREHIYAAKKKGKDWEKMKEEMKSRFDLPESWLANALDAKANEQDSIDDANTDLHIEDFSVFGYRPNAPVVVIDACFCGSFHLEDCIADEYIFQPGHTVVCIANSVNVLQDKWSDRLMGLLAEGGCAGDVARFSTFLESHVIGDPTFRFLPEDKNAPDLDHLINENNPSVWKKMLKADKPEYQALAIQQLCDLGGLSSAQLKEIYEHSPYGIVRMMALMRLADFHDDHFIETVKLASQDSYELVQRQALRFIHDSGDDRLIPALIRVCISNNTSDRVNFDARMALAVMPEKKLEAEFVRQFDDPSVCYVHKDSVRSQILSVIRRNAGGSASDIESLDTLSRSKSIQLIVRAQRNNLVHAYVPYFIRYIEKSTNPELQTMVLEALGWHRESYMNKTIADAALRISKDGNYAPEVRNEALKTYNRMNAR